MSHSFVRRQAITVFGGRTSADECQALETSKVERWAVAPKLSKFLKPGTHYGLLVWLGRLANACEQSGETARAEGYREQRDELDLSRFREFTRFYYQRVVDAVRAREIPVVAMQYPLLSVESLRRLLDYREDLNYLENRTNFETALLDAKYRELFDDNFAGSFGHLSPRGNQLVAENVADALAELMPELGLPRTDLPNVVNKSP